MPAGDAPGAAAGASPLIVAAAGQPGGPRAEPSLGSEIMPQQRWDSATPAGGSPRVLLHFSTGLMPGGHLSSFLLS